MRRAVVAPVCTEERLLHRILHGANPSWPDATGAAFDRSFLEACREHGVAPLVHHHAKETPAWNEWPAGVRAALSRETAMQAAFDMLREQEVVAVLEALQGAGIEAVLLKGTHLAYSHYAAPHLRPRCDTDLLIPAPRRPEVADILHAKGYVRPNAVSGRLVSYQETFHRNAGQYDHVFDVHWRINNSQVFARAISFETALSQSVAIPQLAPSARGLCSPHALLLACMHRAAHLTAEGDGNRLIWLYDIHLLANAMIASEWRHFRELCTRMRMKEITMHAFDATRRAFATALPDALRDEAAPPGRRELSAEHLHAGRWRILLTDLRALGTWRDRITLLREVCFPDADYVLARYGSRSRWSLPWGYLRRGVSGVGKLAGWPRSERTTARSRSALTGTPQ